MKHSIHPDWREVSDTPRQLGIADWREVSDTPRQLGIANGVEWYCTEKIDVHGRNDLNWGAQRNMVGLIAKLNFILRTHPGFTGPAHLEVVTRGDGNTLAVLRRAEGADLLVLANLDCANGATIEWDRAKFHADEAFDVVSERKVSLNGAVGLGPGEVLCLAVPGAARGAASHEPSCRAEAGGKALVHLEFPRDATREVVVPEGQVVEAKSDVDFRLRIVDPSSGRTLRVLRSAPGTHRVVFDAPQYVGGGGRCRALSVEVSRYVDGRAERTRSAFLVPPPARRAKVRTALSGEEVRRSPEWRAVLSNGAGAASQVRVGWGEIRSQYDAFLAANPHPTYPSDRLNLWARTRCWLQREGYVREFDARCVTRFAVDPAGRFARWNFTVPCGMGHEASFVFALSLVPGENAASLAVTREKSDALDVGDQVRLVFRPDVEWRSFHGVTKAYADGTEKRFDESSRPVGGNGFDFDPYGKGPFAMRVDGGAYHHEPQWTYSVGHPEEAARGQDGSGDLFSPGWISADLKIGETVTITGRLVDAGRGAPDAGDSTLLSCIASSVAVPAMRPVGEALREALDLFIVRRDDLKTVIAGYPWFLDWGRDTFIFMRGMIAAGMTDDALRILRAFAEFEENGTLPNIIYGKTAGNRDTTDAQLWFVRCVQELSASADVSGLLPTCRSIVDNYEKGTPNGIRVDAESGLVWSPSHFTWMDTNYPACTPRAGYPVEIQALWISALEFLGRREQAERARESLKRLFRRERGYCDCLDAPNGESAANARPDDAVRPNQLFLLTLGVVDDESILDATESLLVPGGIRSLASGHPLYRGVYEGDEDTSRKPAYHNGTAWAWPFPMFAEALVAARRCSKDVALSLLAGAVENLNTGCLCHLSEIADGDAPHAQKGCCAQAWSDSELLRVWLKLGGR